MIEQSLYEHLRDDAGVSALVGAGGAAKIYPFEAVPQGTTTPYITWYEVSGIPGNSFDGTGILVNSRFQIDLYADTPMDLRTLRAAIRAAMESANAIRDFNTLLLTQNDTGQEQNTLYFRYTMDYSIWYNEST